MCVCLIYKCVSHPVSLLSRCYFPSVFPAFLSFLCPPGAISSWSTTQNHQISQYQALHQVQGLRDPTHDGNRSSRSLCRPCLPTGATRKSWQVVSCCPWHGLAAQQLDRRGISRKAPAPRALLVHAEKVRGRQVEAQMCNQTPPRPIVSGRRKVLVGFTLISFTADISFTVSKLFPTTYACRNLNCAKITHNCVLTIVSFFLIGL